MWSVDYRQSLVAKSVSGIMVCWRVGDGGGRTGGGGSGGGGGGGGGGNSSETVTHSRRK